MLTTRRCSFSFSLSSSCLSSVQDAKCVWKFSMRTTRACTCLWRIDNSRDAFSNASNLLSLTCFMAEHNLFKEDRATIMFPSSDEISLLRDSLCDLIFSSSLDSFSTLRVTSLRTFSCTSTSRKRLFNCSCASTKFELIEFLTSPASSLSDCNFFDAALHLLESSFHRFSSSCIFEVMESAFSLRLSSFEFKDSSNANSSISFCLRFSSLFLEDSMT
mmetsp:Transcript_12865/g.27798  ORF Transcript_12865/g.27798 Transcript_12865/m.27798 type:complete len:217 (-) Transcript_12865:46-696(-)